MHGLCECAKMLYRGFSKSPKSSTLIIGRSIRKEYPWFWSQEISHDWGNDKANLWLSNGGNSWPSWVESVGWGNPSGSGPHWPEPPLCYGGQPEEANGGRIYKLRKWDHPRRTILAHSAALMKASESVTCNFLKLDVLEKEKVAQFIFQTCPSPVQMGQCCWQHLVVHAIRTFGYSFVGFLVCWLNCAPLVFPKS